LSGADPDAGASSDKTPGASNGTVGASPAGALPRGEPDGGLRAPFASAQQDEKGGDKNAVGRSGEASQNVPPSTGGACDQRTAYLQEQLNRLSQELASYRKKKR
jgi:hypothetical protein